MGSEVPKARDLDKPQKNFTRRKKLEVAKDTDRGGAGVQKGEEYRALGIPVYVWSG